MNIKKINFLIPFAKELAKNHCNLDKHFHHVSLITNTRGNILGFGVNGKKTHPYNLRFNYKTLDIHSELAAYLSIRWTNTEFVLINFGFNNKFELRCSKPCENCMAWLMTTQVQEIWFSNRNKQMEVL